MKKGQPQKHDLPDLAILIINNAYCGRALKQRKIQTIRQLIDADFALDFMSDNSDAFIQKLCSIKKNASKFIKTTKDGLDTKLAFLKMNKYMLQANCLLDIFLVDDLILVHENQYLSWVKLDKQTIALGLWLHELYSKPRITENNDQYSEWTRQVTKEAILKLPIFSGEPNTVFHPEQFHPSYEAATKIDKLGLFENATIEACTSIGIGTLGDLFLLTPEQLAMCPRSGVYGIKKILPKISNYLLKRQHSLDTRSPESFIRSIYAGSSIPERRRYIAVSKISGKTLAEIGKHLGISREFVRVQYDKARADAMTIDCLQNFSEVCNRILDISKNCGEHASIESIRQKCIEVFSWDEQECSLVFTKNLHEFLFSKNSIAEDIFTPALDAYLS